MIGIRKGQARSTFPLADFPTDNMTRGEPGVRRRCKMQPAREDTL